LHRYPDPIQRELRKAIAEVHGLDPERMLCGNGSDEILELVMRCFLDADSELLLSRNHFVMCDVHGKSTGAAIVLAPERDMRTDIDAVLSCITERTRVIALANPNNPTGTYLNKDELYRLYDAMPGDVLLLLDNAYGEYAPDDYSMGWELVDAFDNVITTNSFSKIYGLAGLRVGWGYFPAASLAAVERIRSPFNVNCAALAAATAAVRDQAFVRHVRDETARERKRICTALDDLGFDVVPSAASFYLLRFDPASGHTPAAVAAYLEGRGIIPRQIDADEPVLRITVGTPAENDAVLDALRDFTS
jgi:histidinol-phosphate aminotransferase